MTYSWKPRTSWLDEKLAELNNELQYKTATTQAQQEELAWWQKPFHWLSEEVEKPFASILLAGATPKTEGTEGMTWLQRQRAEYDAWKAPWGVKGLVENLPLLVAPNVAGAALKGTMLLTGGIKLASAAEKAAEAAGIASKVAKTGEATEAIAETQGIVAKFFQALPRFKLGTQVQKVSYALERSPKLSNYLEMATKSGLTLEERNAANVALRGELTRIGISNEELQAFAKTIAGSEKYAKTYNKIIKFLGDNPSIPNITPSDIDKLGQAAADLVNAGKIEGWDYKAVNSGLLHLKEYILGKAVGDVTPIVKPIASELKVMAKVFGQDFAKSVTEITTSRGSRALSTFVDILNFPRAVLASTDLSVVLRQGGVLFARHPIIGFRGLKTSMKAFVSPKAADEVAELITKNPLYERISGLGGKILETNAGSAKLGQEMFASVTAEKYLPFVRWSDRSFTAGWNKMTWDTLFQEFPKWEKLGASEADLKGLVNFTMQCMGRGNVPQAIDRAGGLLSSIFFAPRLVMSRLQLPLNLFSKSPFVRKEAVKTLSSFLGGGATLLGMAKLGGADVTIDPRSADFGKIKIGDTRLDIWTGYAQYTRLLAQLVTGQSKSEEGNYSSKNRLSTLARFAQSKTSPAAGLILDLLSGQTYMGEETIPKETGALLEQIRNRIAPLFIQDMIDAVSQDGVKGGLLALPGIFGVGVSTYTNDVKRVQNQIAQEKYNMSWDEVAAKYGEMAQYNLGKDSPELQAVMEKNDERTLGTNYGRWREEGTTIENTYQNTINTASQEYALTGDGMTFREKVNNAGLVRRAMYDQRNQQTDYKDIIANYAQPLTEEKKKTMNPLDVARREYYNMMYSPDMTDEFGNYDFAKAAEREELFRQQYGDNSLKYVKEYMGSKFNAPPIYNQLKAAQTLLKPYWAIEDEIIRTRGERFANSKGGQALIARTKKIMLIRNPDMAQAIALFYRQAQ